jgi:hypothetical protein
MSAPSVNRTKTRLFVESNGIVARAAGKIVNVSVVLAAMVVVTDEDAAAMHEPVEGSVWHRLTLTGRLARRDRRSR